MLHRLHRINLKTMSDRTTVIIKNARAQDAEDFKKLKDDNGYTDAGALTYLLNLTRKGAFADFEAEITDLKNQLAASQAEKSELQVRVEELENTAPKEVVKEIEVVKEVEKKLAPGEFVLALPKELHDHLRRARPAVVKDYAKHVKPEAYYCDLAIYALRKFMNYEYSRFSK